MLIHYGNIIRDSRIPPEFFSFRRFTANVGALQVFDYQIPRDRDLWLMSGVCVGEPTGGETLDHLHLIVIPGGSDTPDNNIIIAHAPEVPVPASREVINLAHEIYIPRRSIIRMSAEYSAGVLAKETQVHLTGWLVPSFDMVL